jgi:transcription elongation factor GreA
MPRSIGDLPVLQKLKKELADLKSELHTKLPKELEAARAHGDLSENAEYEACKERQAFLNARITHMEQRIRDLSLYSVSSIPRTAVGYGSRVTLESDEGEERYELVFPEEADAAVGLISVTSPLGKALLNREVGDEVEVRTPKGKRSYQIVELRTFHERGDQPAS